MVDLTKYFETTKHAIDSGTIAELPRPYLGMSQLGHHCPRYLWYYFRWAFVEVHSKRLKRLFARGHREEPEIVKELEKIGIRCYGDQSEMIACGGHIKGHIDGKCLGVIEAPKTEHLAEFKTANAAKFKVFVKSGCEKTNLQYYGQCQIYMKHQKLTRALFIVVNKNDDDWYIERIKYDSGVAADLERIGEYIVSSPVPPKKPYTKTFYKCRYCSAKDICHYEGAPPKTCRTCVNSNPAKNGEWTCEISGGFAIPFDFQKKGCLDYTCRL